MASNPLLQVRIKNARSSENELRTVKQKVIENLADIALLRNLFTAYKNAFEANGGDDAAAYQTALGVLPVDNPSTTGIDEGVSEAELIKKAEGYFGKSWGEIKPSDVENITDIEDSLKTVQSKVREYVAKGSSIDMQLNDIKSEIADLTSLQKSSGIIDDGSGES